MQDNNRDNPPIDSPLVTVVVTTHFSAAYLERCLVSIKQQSYKNIEIVIVDHMSNDGTQEIAKKYTDRCFFGQAVERSAKRNFGVLRAAGKYVLIADSDMILSTNVISDCVKGISSNSNLKAMVVPEQSLGSSFWGNCKALERSFYVGIDWMEAARFFLRDVFIEVGGYDETNTGSEDYDLPQRIQAKYGAACVGRISEFIVQNEVDLGFLKSCLKKFYYSQSFPKYANSPANSPAFKKQSNLFLRYSLFLSQPKKLFSRPHIGLGLLVLKTAEFFAGGVGYFIAKTTNSQPANE